MEQNTPKFRLRLNLFDGIVLLIVLAVGAVVLWTALKPQAPAANATPQSTSTVRYTVRFQRMPEGTSQLVEPGDQLTDSVKNFAIGTVVSAQAVPVETQVLDHVHRRNVLSSQEGFEDVIAVVEAPCSANGESITVGGGYILRVGATTYIKAEGYMVSGPIIAMEVEGEQ